MIEFVEAGIVVCNVIGWVWVDMAAMLMLACFL